MIEKPQAPQEEQADLLEKVFTQGLERINAPTQAVAAGDAKPPVPKQKGGGEAGPPKGRKNRRSAVYLYLLILFGAAFLMLLLAYFIQQRSSKNMQESMNISREELLTEIKELKDQNSALEEEAAALSRELESWKLTSSNWEERYNVVIQGTDDLRNSYYLVQVELNSWQLFWELEQFYQAGDYKSCASILLEQAQGQYAYYQTPNGAGRRYEEIVRAVIDAGILKENYEQHPEEYADLLNALMSG